jgi:S1-C subfamily serine protease
MKRSIVPAVAMVLGALLGALPWAGLQTVAADVDPAVLKAESERITGRGGGSGVVISPDGFALTNFHVTRPCGAAMKCGMADGRVYDAVIVGLDPTGDVALIKLLGRDDFPCAELGDSDACRVGDWVFVMGNPFLLATRFKPTVSHGILSGMHRYQYPSRTLLEYADCLQTDAAVNPGNSGGPLFNARGQLIGINGRCSFEKRGRVNVGVGYAISINQIKNFLGYLHSGRIVDHATLGALVTTDEDGRVVVSDILEQSDAFRRGLRYDDEIVRFAGRPITTTNELKNILGIFPKGWRMPLSFRRDGRRYDVMVRLHGVHRQEELFGKPKTPVQPKPIPKPGEKPKPKPEDLKPEKDKPAEKPAPKPKLKPQKPTPGRPARRPRKKAPLPEVVKKHYEAKRGYANYYFNKLNRDRVWKAWADRAGFTSPTGRWTIEASTPDDRAVRFEFGEADGLIKLPGGEFTWTAGEELGSSLGPPRSGGLLLTLHLWRRLAVEGPGKFGAVHYLGTVPLAGHPRLVDVLVGLHGGVECRFFFDPVDHDLLAIEMFPEDDVDPCEVRFSEFRQAEGRMVPGRMEVRIGNDIYGIFRLDEFHFEKTTDPP